MAEGWSVAGMTGLSCSTRLTTVSLTPPDAGSTIIG
jgi:hypothetical protein